MEHYVIGQPIDNDLFKDTITNLYNMCKVFPKQKIEMFDKINLLSTYLKEGDNKLNTIITEVKDTIKKSDEDRKLIFISKSKTEDSTEVKKEDSSGENEQKEIEKREINRIYYLKICSIIESMYKDLGDNISDNEKLIWIYKYVFEIPFDHNKPDEDFAKKYSKKSVYYSKKKSEESYAMACTFKDLCDFACFDNTYCTIVRGKHQEIIYFWNAILTPRGLFYCDASAPWNGEDSFNKQFMLTPKELKTKIKGYSNYSKTDCTYVPNKMIDHQK